jgi:CheY-like chemotaxis protein
VAEAELLKAEEPAPGPERPALDSVTVLVVDDDPLVLMNTSAMLEDLGHEVLEATTAEQALRVLRRSADDIDLVITDQMMPGMTGTQLIEALQAEHVDVPVILASGYAELPDDKFSGLVRLGKPFAQAELAHALVVSLRPEAQVLPFRPKHG